MKTLRVGTKGKDVERWQQFLRSFDLYMGVVDGDFGPLTDKATKQYQRKRLVYPDGIVGNLTYAAAVSDGFSVVVPDPATRSKDSPLWPPKPNFKTPSFAKRQQMFGAFKYSPAPTKSNPEGIKIHGSWVADNIVKVKVPQIAGKPGATKTGVVWFHRKAVDQLVGLFDAWEKAGLSPLILSYGGSWVPRFVRGSRTTLSNHAFGSAIDLNVPWNYLGAQPALVGAEGSVRELVPLANKWGFYWGGHWGPDYGGGRVDGMHFEVAKLL